MKNEINVTPLIDVMLVLLILFMIVTPLSQKGLDVRIPDTAPPGKTEGPPQLILEVDGQGGLTLNQEPLTSDELPRCLGEILDARSDKTLFVKADEKLRYREVVAVLDVARGSGVERVGIVRRD